jgi:RNA polymerase sigma factor (sigma-70 family)
MNAMPNPPIDEELALLRAGKSAAACAKIVALHGPLVKSACYRVLRDEGLAEDAAQETFVLLMRKAQSLPAGTSLAGWLYHAACRTALNHQRAAMRRRVRENSVEAMNQMTPDTQPNLWTEIEPHLDDAMLALPERQRDLVVQCYFQNQSQRSAAAALGCSESVVSRELSAAIEALRQFFAKRRVAVSGVALGSLLSVNAATASMAGGATMVAAMMAAPTTSTLMAALVQSKLLISSVAVAGAVTVASVGYYSGSTRAASELEGRGGAYALSSGTGGTTKAGGAGLPNSKAVKATRKGKWEGTFKFTSAMAQDALKKEVLLENDPDKRYELLRKMGIGLSRKGFDDLIAKGLDPGAALGRDTFAVLANRTDVFDNYLMAWSNEDPMAALNWASAQPDGPLGMRKQLLYALEAGQLEPETLREWIDTLTKKVMREEATIALEWLGNPTSIIGRMGKGGNEGFLVDLAMLTGGERLDWAAFGQKLGTGKRAIVARAMRQALDGGLGQVHLDQMIQGLATSDDAAIGISAVAILTAARGGTQYDFATVLKLAAEIDVMGMTSFKNDVLRGWAATDPTGALQHTGRLKDMDPMREVMRALTTLPDEATLLVWMDGMPQKAKDIAISALYGYGSNGPFEQLEKAMRSPYISDQVEAVQEVMRMMTPQDAKAAAEWVKQLPPGKERQDVALALSRRLAAVDPQAALDLMHTSGLRGKEYDIALSHAVTQFAAQNDLAESTQFIQQIADPKAYADALGQLAMVKFAGHPQEAFAYLQANSRGDWQPAALRMLSEVYYNKLGNIDANAAEILKLDLARLGTEAPLRASNFCKIWIDHQVPVGVPLAWTQQLPGNMGRETRLQLARNKELKPAALETLHAWVQIAPISPAERAQLQTVLGKRLGDEVAR